MQFIAYQLDKTSATPLYLQLEQQIKRAIFQQNLQQGDKLPSKRHLCQFLQISQSTVETAYAQLVAEGYLESVPKVGFFVSVAAGSALLPQTLNESRAFAKNAPETTACITDFNPHRIDSRHFPFEQWKKISKSLVNVAHADWLHLGEAQGDFALRTQLARYLHSARGVQCAPEQIVLAAGVEHLMQWLMLMLESEFGALRYGIEAFGYALIVHLLTAYQKPFTKLPLNPESKRLDLGEFLQSGVDVAYITPSHQYPFGSVLSIAERQQLLAWAAEQPQRFLIEDDYDGEFRYQGKPIPALQSLDRAEKVIYFGSLSKLLMPSIRVSFMVLPPRLLPLFQRLSNALKCSVSRLEQQVVARFIEQGDFERHINKMRKRYRTKMEMLCRHLKPYADKIRYFGEHSGFYLLLEVYNDPRSAAELLALSEAENIKIYPINWQNQRYFVVGFGDLSEAELQKGIERLLQRWFG